MSELKILYKWRRIKNVLQKDSQKCKVLKDWLDRKDDPAPSVENWTTENENHLERMKTEEIKLNNTAVGRTMQNIVDDTLASVSHLPAEQICQLKDALPPSPASSPSTNN